MNANRMAIFKRFGRDKQQAAGRRLEQQELLAALSDTQDQLRCARIGFNTVSAPELIEASVYEINSLQARYSYLIRLAREEGCELNEVFKEQWKR